MPPDHAAPPELPRRRPWRSDPALFDTGIRPRRGRRGGLQLGETYYSHRPRSRPAQPCDFGWFRARRPLPAAAA